MTTILTKAKRDLLRKEGEELEVKEFDWSTVDGCLETIEDATFSYLREHINLKTANFVIDAAAKSANIRLKMKQSDADLQINSFMRNMLDVTVDRIGDEEGAVDAEYELLTEGRDSPVPGKEELSPEGSSS